MRAISLSSEDGRSYCAGAEGTGVARAGAALAGGRACEFVCAGRRGGVGVAASAAPGVAWGGRCSWGGRCGGGGSAVRILTGGLEGAAGGERVFRRFLLAPLAGAA